MAERAALITGASGGIGLAIAAVLAEEGYGLTLSARRPEKLEGAVSHLREAGHEVQTVAANVADEEQLKGVFTAHEEKYGRLDVLVNNAGVGVGAALGDIQTKFLDMQLAVNLRSIILGTREGIPLLRKAGAEHRKALIVNTASIAGKAGQPWLSIYGATKAAVDYLSQAIAANLGSRGITVNAVAPGATDTDFLGDFGKDPAMVSFMAQEIALGHIGDPKDVASAVALIASPDAGWITGERVRASGGERL